MRPPTFVVRASLWANCCPGKIARGASEIVVPKLLKISSEQRGLLKFFGGRRDGLCRAGKLL